jgi:hypothetical protein
MGFLRLLVKIVFWMGLWIAIPAALLYPLALWMAKHTQISGLALGRTYMYAIAALFLPAGFLVDWIYRRFVRTHGVKGRRPN